MYWKRPISILDMSGYVTQIFLEQMANLFANSGDTDRSGSALLGNYPFGELFAAM